MLLFFPGIGGVVLDRKISMRRNNPTKKYHVLVMNSFASPRVSRRLPLTLLLLLVRRRNAAKKKKTSPFAGATPADTGSWLLCQDQDGRMYW